MGRIKDGLKGLAGRLKTLPGGRQGKALLRVVQFFAIMVVLTIFARGAAGATMPVVETATLSQHNIRVSNDYTGTITATNKEEVKIPAGLVVEKVHVSPGSTVKEGDVLVSFDTSTLEQNLAAQKIALQELQLALVELQKNMTQDDSMVVSAQKAVKSAQTSYDEAKAAADQSVAAAQAAIDKAQSDLNAANQALESARAALQTEVEGENRPEQVAELHLAVENANQAALVAIDLLKAAQEALEPARQAGEKSVAMAKEMLDEANTALAEAQKTFDEGKASFQLEQQKRQLQISQKKLEIEKQQEVVADLQKLASTEGAVTAPVAGTVVAVTPAAKVETTEVDSISISTGAEGYLVEFPVPQDKAREIKMGAQVTVKQGNYYWGSEARVIGRGMPDETGNVTVRAQLTDPNWSDGDAVTVTLVFSDKQYWNCLPLSAVRPDSGGHYVFALYEERTILGTQTVARKVAVTLQDQDKEFAAVEGVFEYDMQVVVSGNKPINDGDMVRLNEASTK